jgi:hypothetical protein
LKFALNVFIVETGIIKLGHITPCLFLKGEVFDVGCDLYVFNEMSNPSNTLEHWNINSTVHTFSGKDKAQLAKGSITRD